MIASTINFIIKLPGHYLSPRQDALVERHLSPMSPMSPLGHLSPDVSNVSDVSIVSTVSVVSVFKKPTSKSLQGDRKGPYTGRFFKRAGRQRHPASLAPFLKNLPV